MTSGEKLRTEDKILTPTCAYKYSLDRFAKTMLTKRYILHSTFSKVRIFSRKAETLGRHNDWLLPDRGVVLIRVLVVHNQGDDPSRSDRKKRRLGLGVMKSMLIWIVAWLLIMPYLMGKDASILTTLSPEFWGYFASGIIGWYLGVWFGPKRVKFNV